MGAVLSLLSGFGLYFWIGDESNWGFLNSLVSLSRNKGAEPSWIIWKVQIVLAIESIKTLSPYPEGVGKLSNLVKYCVWFLSCFLFLLFLGYFSAAFIEFLAGCYLARNSMWVPGHHKHDAKGGSEIEEANGNSLNAVKFEFQESYWWYIFLTET